MKRILLLAVALLLGFGAGEFLTTNFAFRAWVGRLVRRGELRELVGRRGIYSGEPASASDDALVARAAAREPLPESVITREIDLLRAQLPNERAWEALLAYAGLSAGELRAEVASNLRARRWLEAKVAAAQVSPNEQEARQFYQAHLANFQEPLRFRASHLFLAAPKGYPDEVIAAKSSLIKLLALRLDHGESFPELVANFSEDAATKGIAGDMDYFDATRMLPAVWNAAQNLAVGATSAPVRSRLGFHILRLTDRLPPTQLTFAQARLEIALALENERRAAVIAAAVAALGGKNQFAAPRD